MNRIYKKRSPGAAGPILFILLILSNKKNTRWREAWPLARGLASCQVSVGLRPDFRTGLSPVDSWHEAKPRASGSIRKAAIFKPFPHSRHLAYIIHHLSFP